MKKKTGNYTVILLVNKPSLNTRNIIRREANYTVHKRKRRIEAKKT